MSDRDVEAALSTHRLGAPAPTSTEHAPSGCGCAPRAEPIVCTLAGREQQERRAAELRDVFVALERTEPLTTCGPAFRWIFRDEPGLEARLRELARREHECCRFFDFRITREGGALVWEARAPEDAASVLDELMRLPETLGGSAPLTTLRRALGDAGLEFPDDLG